MNGLSGVDVWVGYAACLLSCLGFGTMFAPLRSIQAKDGVFVQWIECSVAFLFGMVVNALRGFPPFNPVAAIGGILYATGNIFSVPIVQGIGVGLGMLIWGTIQVLVGWSVARFGFFSLIESAPVKHDLLNYFGMIITLVCGILFVFVTHDSSSEEVKKEAITASSPNNGVYEMACADTKNEILEDSPDQPLATSRKDSIHLTNLLKKLPYISMAVCLGILHGMMMSPVDAAKQRMSAEQKKDKYYMFDLVFSYYSTVFAFSTIYFLIYCVVRKHKTHISAALVLPSALYGVLWSIGMTLWFLSADRLEQTVAYPITTRLPAIIGAITDVFIYRSIKVRPTNFCKALGRGNIAYLGFVILLGITGVVLIALSNQSF